MLIVVTSKLGCLQTTKIFERRKFLETEEVLTKGIPETFDLHVLQSPPRGIKTLVKSSTIHIN
jgi:hypothetical protein